MQIKIRFTLSSNVPTSSHISNIKAIFFQLTVHYKNMSQQNSMYIVTINLASCSL